MILYISMCLRTSLCFSWLPGPVKPCADSENAWWWLGCALDLSSDAGGLHPSGAGAGAVRGVPAAGQCRALCALLTLLAELVWSVISHFAVEEMISSLV